MQPADGNLASSQFALKTEHTDPKMGPYQVTKHHSGEIFHDGKVC